MENKKYNIKEQWDLYIRTIHYNVMLKKKFKKLEKQIKEQRIKTEKAETELKKEEETERQHIAKLSNRKDHNKNKEIYLQGLEQKKGVFEKIKWNLKDVFPFLFKFDGYLLHGNKGKDFKIYKIKDLRFLKSLKHRELYNLDEKIGSYNGKPLFMCLYPYAISLKIREKSEELYYDAESYYNYINTAVKGSLTKLGGSMDIMDFIKKNFMYILLAIGIIFVLTTPQGKEFLGGIIQQPNP